MKKRIVTLLLALALTLSLLPGAALAEGDLPEPTVSAEPTEPPEPSESPEPTAPPEPTEVPETGMAAFVPRADSTPLWFADVPAWSWYADAVALLSRLGLVRGVGDAVFGPEQTLTAADCAALSVRIYAMYHGLSPELDAAPGESWHAPYMRLAAAYGIMPYSWAADAVLTRRQALSLLYHTLPAEELGGARNCGHIPGLFASDAQYGELICLYEAGILTGEDAYGTLNGAGQVTRSQYITMLARLIAPELRSASPLAMRTGFAAFETCSDAHPFVDVAPGCYYDASVRLLYNMGLVQGTSPQTYSPDAAVSLLQAIILAVRVYETYHGVACAPRTYLPEIYLALARDYGLFYAELPDAYRCATRAEVAGLIVRALSPDAFPVHRHIESIPDVAPGAPYYDEILTLYRSGVVAGKDSARTFGAADSITRAELAAMFSRAVYPGLRMKVDLSSVEAVIRSTIAGFRGTWSVYLLDVTSGESVTVDSWRMWSASLIKLYVMGAVLEALENGTLANSEKIQSQLRDMITWSSNDAWKWLATQLGGGSYNLGMQRVNEWCDRNGYPDSGKRANGYANTTSVTDTGLFLQRALAGTNVSPAASAQMISLLQAQQRTSKIPAGVPAGVVTANKTGELHEVQNDAAIIYAPFGTYILVVLTQDGLILQIRELSSRVYAAMEQALT